MTHTPPPFDPELIAVLEANRDLYPVTITDETLMDHRKPTPDVPETLERLGLVAEDHEFTHGNGETGQVSVLRKAGATGEAAAGIFYIHGGGLMFGDRWSGLLDMADWIDRHGVVVVTAEYPLAPEVKHPEIHDAVYAALDWTAGHASELGFDPSRLIVIGSSAGGGLAAGVSLRARDEQGPRIAAQMLQYPMLDDRNETISSQQISGIGLWDRGSNELGWRSALGEACGTDDVSIYSAPGRAEDLSGLPPTFIDVGSAEVFRDENVAFARRIWEAGGWAELHVWPGGYHAFEGVLREAQLSKEMLAARHAWLSRMIASFDG